MVSVPFSPSVANKTICLLVTTGWLSLLAQSACAADIKVYRSVQTNGVIAFSDKPPAQGQYTLLRYRCFACGGDNQTDFSKTPLFLQKFHQQIEQAGKLHRLESALIKAVIHAESGFNANALSPRGAVGLMQLMPATATELAVSDPRDPAANINAGSAYLSSLLRQFDGKLELALAAYNAGPDTVRRYQAVPPYSETQNYVKRVQQLLQRYRAQPAVAG